MEREFLVELLKNENLKDIPTIYIVKILVAIMEVDYDNEDRP